MRFILRLEKESRKVTSASKIIINKREAKNNVRETKKTKIETKKTKINAKVDAKVATIATIIAITTIDKKRLLRLRKRFVCIYVSFVLEIVLMLLSCLLLFDNSREYINNTLYNQKLVKLLN